MSYCGDLEYAGLRITTERGFRDRKFRVEASPKHLCVQSAVNMPSESGFLSRIASQREVMVSLGCLSLVLLTLFFSRGSVAVLMLNTRNESRSFPDMEAAFCASPKHPFSKQCEIFGTFGLSLNSYENWLGNVM